MNKDTKIKKLESDIKKYESKMKKEKYRIRKVGTSLVVTIPNVYVEALGLQAGDIVKIFKDRQVIKILKGE
jgi:bifunctional DNA-binding transcriptional regulator/antitoxin component of YhaV-PrlF toxin-antitoxin module